MEEQKPTYVLVEDVTGKPKPSGPQVINAYGYEIKVPYPPKNSCKKCFGRGYIGQESKTKLIIMCKKCYPMI